MSTSREGREVSALIGLGGNVGDVCASMQKAIDSIQAHAQCRILKISNVYKTPPWGVTDQAWFLNACAEIATTLLPDDLLKFMLSVERAQGRVRDVRWGPRTLDLDLLVYGDEQVRTDQLTVPHPRIAERPFVIVPLLDIAAARVIDGRTVSDYAAALDKSGIEATDRFLTLPVS